MTTRPAQRLREANGRFAQVPLPDLDAVRADYEADDKLLVEVADRHRMSLSTLNRLRVEHGWRARQPRVVDSNDLLMRLFGILEDQTAYMEKHMVRAGTTETVVLNRLAMTLSRLVDIRRKADLTRPLRRMTTDQIEALRSQLETRIADLEHF
jgi:hypothetical protein